MIYTIIDFEEDFALKNVLYDFTIQDMKEVLDRMQRDKTFRKRLLDIIPAGEFMIGKHKRYRVSFFTFQCKCDGVIMEDVDMQNLPSVVDDNHVEIIFEVSMSFGPVSVPAFQFSIPTQRMK